MVFHIHTKYTKIYTKYIENIQDIYKIPGGGQAAAARPGPEPRARAGPWGFIFGYILDIFMYFVWCPNLVFFDWKSVQS